MTRRKHTTGWSTTWCAAAAAFACAGCTRHGCMPACAWLPVLRVPGLGAASTPCTCSWEACLSSCHLLLRLVCLCARDVSGTCSLSCSAAQWQLLCVQSKLWGLGAERLMCAVCLRRPCRKACTAATRRSWRTTAQQVQRSSSREGQAPAADRALGQRGAGGTGPVLTRAELGVERQHGRMLHGNVHHCAWLLGGCLKLASRVGHTGTIFRCRACMALQSALFVRVCIVCPCYLCPNSRARSICVAGAFVEVCAQSHRNACGSLGCLLAKMGLR
ncbi:hypothetical protein V8C86DRAFT_1153210 [Haematococcus lacustris]